MAAHLFPAVDPKCCEVCRSQLATEGCSYYIAQIDHDRSRHLPSLSEQWSFHPPWLVYIRDYTVLLYSDYNKPILGSLLTNQYYGMSEGFWSLLISALAMCGIMAFFAWFFFWGMKRGVPKDGESLGGFTRPCVFLPTLAVFSRSPEVWYWRGLAFDFRDFYVWRR